MNSGFGAMQMVSPPLETALSSITGKGSDRTDPSSSLDTSEVLGAIGRGTGFKDSRAKDPEDNFGPQIQIRIGEAVSETQSGRGTLELKASDVLIPHENRTYKQYISQSGGEFISNQYQANSAENRKEFVCQIPAESTLPESLPRQVPEVNDKSLYEPVFDDYSDDERVQRKNQMEIASSKSANFNFPKEEYCIDPSRLTWNQYPQSAVAGTVCSETREPLSSDILELQQEFPKRAETGAVYIPPLSKFNKFAELGSGADSEEREAGYSNRNLPTFGKGSFRSSKSGSRGQHRSNSANRDAFPKGHHRMNEGQIPELGNSQGMQDDQGCYSPLDFSNHSHMVETTERANYEDNYANYDPEHLEPQRLAQSHMHTPDDVMFFVKVIDFEEREQLMPIHRGEDCHVTVNRFCHQHGIYDYALMICLAKRIQREIDRFNMRSSQYQPQATQQLPPGMYHAAGRMGHMGTPSDRYRGDETSGYELRTSKTNILNQLTPKLPPRAGVSPSSSTGRRQDIPPLPGGKIPGFLTERDTPAANSITKPYLDKIGFVATSQGLIKKSPTLSQVKLSIETEIQMKQAPGSATQKANISKSSVQYLVGASGSANKMNTPNQRVTPLQQSETSSIARFLAKETDAIFRTQVQEEPEQHQPQDAVNIYRDQPIINPSTTVAAAKLQPQTPLQDVFLNGPQLANSPLTLLEKKTPPSYLQNTPGFCFDRKRASHEVPSQHKASNTKRVLMFGNNKVANLTTTAASLLSSSQSGLGLGKENNKYLANKKQEPSLNSTAGVRSVFKQADQNSGYSVHTEMLKKLTNPSTLSSQQAKHNMMPKKPAGSGLIPSNPVPSPFAKKDSLFQSGKNQAAVQKQGASRLHIGTSELSQSTVNWQESKPRPAAGGTTSGGMQSQRNLRSSFNQQPAGVSGASPKPGCSRLNTSGSNWTSTEAAGQGSANKHRPRGSNSTAGARGLSGAKSQTAVLLGGLTPQQIAATRALFTKLDGDLDGLLNSNRLSYFAISPEWLKAFEPLLLEMKRNPNKHYDYQQFEEAMCRLKLVSEALKLHQRTTRPV